MARIEISIPEQVLKLWVDEFSQPLSYPISSSKFGTGTEEGSFKTPTGDFQVCEKFGDDCPIGTIFKGRKPIGLYDPADPTDSDLVLTRILWLTGLQPHNANTKERYIYLHGTNQEDRIGSPASIGCIRLRNTDIIELYELTPIGCPLSIIEA